MRSSMHLVAGTSRADQTETSTSGSTEIILHQVYHECVCVGGGGGGVLIVVDFAIGFFHFFLWHLFWLLYLLCVHVIPHNHL